MKKFLVLVVCFTISLMGQANADIITSRANLDTLLASSSGWSAATETKPLPIVKTKIRAVYGAFSGRLFCLSV